MMKMRSANKRGISFIEVVVAFALLLIFFVVSLNVLKIFQNTFYNFFQLSHLTEIGRFNNEVSLSVRSARRIIKPVLPGRLELQVYDLRFPIEDRRRITNTVTVVYYYDGTGGVPRLMKDTTPTGLPTTTKVMLKEPSLIPPSAADPYFEVALENAATDPVGISVSVHLLSVFLRKNWVPLRAQAYIYGTGI